MKKFYWLFIINLFLIPFAFANDSAGTISSGGIQFTQSPGISLEREELEISPSLIQVSYLFKNNTKDDITTQVFFPLPPYKEENGPQGSWDDEVEPSLSAPFKNFAVSVQGQSVSFNTDISATMNGQNITKQLQAAHIPLNPEIVAGRVPTESPKLTEMQTKAKQLGLLDDNGNPKWQKQIIYYWTQTFPAGQEILIQHQYRPAAGMFFDTVDATQTFDKKLPQIIQRMKATFNIDYATLQQNDAVTHWLKQRYSNTAVNNMYAYFYSVNYILTTAANWDGPIKNFALLLDKPANGTLAYNDFYQNQKIEKKQTPQQLQIFIKNFEPKKDLQVMFVTDSAENAAGTQDETKRIHPHKFSPHAL